ncbi:RNA 2',3'-cyclic phosphodiesterase [Streptomyces armeniacus]|uniref:RNA 2',3'-cyclic phosphodiesterase n=1 Tax=Streptomyces armeniacus TaxID=83291 RepID=A0A345XKY1_9ACTN|nr:RNA 2',3'-cyclic phosphodiesterase [Streptomyces armeniacus]AXK32297.1 RNA 2',3'-cyclic phosphodiesterase [Streptomyces armeniacus]
MRLFAAVLPPPAATAELAVAVDALRELPGLPGADRMRWTQREGWHFTLAFYGEVAEPVRPELERRLARAAARGRPLTLRLAGAGRFGERTLWMGADGDRERLGRLAAAASAAGRRSGIAMEEQAFHAHLTLARTRRAAPATVAGGTHEGDGADGVGGADGTGGTGATRGTRLDLRPYVAALAGFEGAPWTAGELALVRSTPPTSGVPGEQPRYTTVAAWRLGR